MVNLNRRHFLTAGLGTAAVVGLAACQQQGGTPTGSSKPSDVPKLPNSDLVRAEAAQVADGGKITFAISAVPANWNSDEPSGNEADTALVRYPQGYSQAIKVSQTGELSLNPDYLVEAKLKSEDPQVVSVKFNPKAVWEDGTPITIADLAAYAKALSGADEKYRIVNTQGWEDISEVKQTDDQFTGEIHFKKAWPDWMSQVYPNLPASISSDPAKFNEGFVDKWVPSFGPYLVKSYDKSGGVITLERNPKWWGAKGKLDTIVFRQTTQENLPNAFANSELDVVDVANGDVYDRASKRADAMIKTAAGLLWSNVTINTKNVADLQVRKAIAYGINRDLIGQAVIGPLKAPVVLLDNVIYMPGQVGYEKSWDVKYDRAAATKILTDAGYAKDASGVLAKDGKPLTYSITVPAGVKSNADRALQIQKDLNALGMKVELKSVPGGDYFPKNIVPKAYDLATFSWGGSTFAISGGSNLFTSKSNQNHTAWGSDEVDKLVADANSTLDQAKRVKFANELSKKVLEAYVTLPIYATPLLMAMKNTVVNYGPAQFETIDWTVVGHKK